MAIPVSEALLRLDNLMSDDDRIRWDEAERIRWFNDATKEIVLRRPAARAVTLTVTLAAGSRQSAPAGASQVLDITHNIKATGAAGKAVTITDRNLLDRTAPTWRSAKAGETRHFMIDDRDPTSFAVYPPAVNGAQVEGLFSQPPDDVSEPTDSIDMRTEFIGAIINWALYRCHTKDSEYANGAVAAQHYQAFTDAIGAPAAAAVQNSPQGNSV